MKDFSVEEILDYSRSIEMESYAYYTEVGKTVVNAELKKLAADLSEEEMRHYNRINKILEDYKLSRDELDARVQIRREDHSMLVETRELPEDPTAQALLERAYEREVSTGNVYRRLLTFTDLADEIIQTLEDLAEQETGHASRIKSLLEMLS